MQPLFDTVRAVRNLETSLRLMWEAHVAEASGRGSLTLNLKLETLKRRCPVALSRLPSFRLPLPSPPRIPSANQYDSHHEHARQGLACRGLRHDNIFPHATALQRSLFPCIRPNPCCAHTGTQRHDAGERRRPHIIAGDVGPISATQAWLASGHAPQESAERDALEAKLHAMRVETKDAENV